MVVQFSICPPAADCQILLTPVDSESDPFPLFCVSRFLFLRSAAVKFPVEGKAPETLLEGGSTYGD
jgi:hypothetical protein